MECEITPGLQEYLAAIYRLQRAKRKAIRAKEIARELGVTLPSVTDALRKLSKAGLVNYRRYNEITLTSDGERSALLILDKENIFLEFLRDVLGLDEDVAREEACWIEHGVSWESARRLKLFIEFLKENIDDMEIKFKKFVEEREKM